MNALELVVQLVEAANLDRAPVGIEIECGIRLDLRGPQLDDFLADLDFVSTGDSSVEMRAKSLEMYYTDFELVSAEPMPWSSLRHGLTQALAFLKREDMVEVPRTRFPSWVRPVQPVFKGQASKPRRSAASKVIHLPRAIVPQNFTAGTHFHFDHSWFDSAAHAKNLVLSLNQLMAGLPDALPKPRYAEWPAGRRPSRGGSPKRASFYASIDPVPIPGNADQSSARNFLSSLANQPGLSRYTAFNVQAVENRGDVEFRFPHSTLNMATISGWFQLLAELIEFSKAHVGGWDEFEAYASKEAPEVNKFLDAARKRSASSRDPLAIQNGMTRAVRKLMSPAKAAKPVPSPSGRGATEAPARGLLDRNVLLQALDHDPEPGREEHWIENLQSIIDAGLAPQANTEIQQRINDLRARTLAPAHEGLQEGQVSRLKFQRKVVLFLRDQSKLVITRLGNRFVTSGLVRGESAGSLHELDMVLRDVVSDHGGIAREWVDPPE